MVKKKSLLAMSEAKEAPTPMTRRNGTNMNVGSTFDLTAANVLQQKSSNLRQSMDVKMLAPSPLQQYQTSRPNHPFELEFSVGTKQVQKVILQSEMEQRVKEYKIKRNQAMNMRNQTLQAKEKKEEKRMAKELKAKNEKLEERKAEKESKRREVLDNRKKMLKYREDDLNEKQT